MRRLVIALSLLLLAPATAGAKGLSNAEVCGTAGCADITDRAGYGIIDGGGGSVDPPAAQPFVEVNVTFRGDAAPGEPVPHDTLIFQFAPAAGVIRNEEGVWYEPDAATTVLLRNTASNVSPFPASKLARLAPEVTAPAAPATTAAASAPARAPATDDGTSWLVFAGIAVAALVAAAAVVLTMRRHRAAPAP
jgi:LPXTG-motif cell wall-anchored protein